MPTIIIVDDKEENRYVLENFFNLFDPDADIKIIMATTGTEAVEKTKEYKPDLVLMDIKMETDDAGLAATKIIREDPETASVPVWAVTASAMEESRDQKGDRQKCLDAGCNEYIAKPFDQVDLIKKVSALLNLPIPPETKALMNID